MYTITCRQKCPPLFFNNSVKSQPILITFGTQNLGGNLIAEKYKHAHLTWKLLPHYL